MKILFTVATYYPDVDGVQNVTEYQAEYLAEQGHDVTVIASNNHGRYKSNEDYKKVHIIRVNAFNKNMLHYGNKVAFQNLVIKTANDSDVMINVSPESFSTDWVLPIVDNIHCKKFVMNHGMHDFKWNKYNKSSGKELIKKVLRDLRWGLFYQFYFRRFDNYDGVIFLHEQDTAKKYFDKKNYKKCHVVYNCAGDEFFEIDGVVKKKQIINVGTYNDRKNQLECLDVFYGLDDKSWKLVLIGNPDGEYYRRLIDRKKELDQRYGVRDVEILCNIDRQTTVRKIKESSIYLLTSTWEAFPISLIEAMASGATFVSSNVGVVKYIPYGKVGNTQQELVDELNALINNDTYIELGQQAYTYALNNFSISTQMKKFENIITN